MTIIDKRIETLKDQPDHISMEIASSFEAIKFAKGEGEFKDLAPAERRRQLDHIINILEEVPGWQRACRFSQEAKGQHSLDFSL